MPCIAGCINVTGTVDCNGNDALLLWITNFIDIVLQALEVDLETYAGLVQKLRKEADKLIKLDNVEGQEVATKQVRKHFPWLSVFLKDE